MDVTKLLPHWLSGKSLIGHRMREESLLKAVQSLLSGSKLALSHLGRMRQGEARVKHQIKAVDRLLGNEHLHGERKGLYRAMAESLMRGVERPVLLVDWADFELRREWLMLKAAMPLQGRAITVYEQVFPFKEYNSPGAHREFLRALRSILPAGCKPIIVTDAGFRGPWFREVASYGWDWVGRIRNGIKYYDDSTGRWRYTDSLYKEATPRMRHLGEFQLSKRRKYTCRLYLVRAHKPRKRQYVRRRTTKHQHNQAQYRRLHKAPWLLATSLAHGKHASRRIKRLYSQRMQVEETFRDMKNHRWGFGVRYARSNDKKRLEILLLISALASLTLWLCGVYVEQRGESRHYQANTERRRRVLSLVFLGQQYIQREHCLPSPQQLRRAFVRLKQLINHASSSLEFVGIP